MGPSGRDRLAHAADGVLLVVQPGTTRRIRHRGAAVLQKVQAKVIGAVLNKSRSSRRRRNYATFAVSPPVGQHEDWRTPLPDAAQRLQTLVGRQTG